MIPFVTVLVLVAGLISFALPCVPPLAALAAAVALRFGRGPALVAVAAAWAANEAAGFLFFGFPFTRESYAWAVLILLAAAATAALVPAIADLMRSRPAPLRSAVAIVGATVVFEVVLGFAGWSVGLSVANFRLSIDALVLEANVVAFVAFRLLTYAVETYGGFDAAAKR